MRLLGIREIAPVAFDRDSKRDVGAVIHEVIAALVGLVKVCDVIEADIPCRVEGRNLGALPDNFDWRRDDRFDDDLARADFFLRAHALLTPAAMRIWRCIRSHPARSCEKAKNAPTAIADM